MLYDETYQDPFGEPFTVKEFKYYISHLEVTGRDGKTVATPGCFLIDEADSTSKEISIRLPDGEINQVSFLLGVDSAGNTGGVHTGSLDPANGMFWAWNSGYVHAKIEGSSAVSGAPAHSFSWHVGGYKPTENASRKITIAIPHGQANNNKLQLDADLLKWFNGTAELSIKEHPVCHQPGKLAMQIADNYSTMFSLAQ